MNNFRLYYYSDTQYILRYYIRENYYLLISRSDFIFVYLCLKIQDATNQSYEIKGKEYCMGRKYTFIPQKFSAPYPKKIQMQCGCGRIFTTSASLTDHLHKIHMGQKKRIKKLKYTQKDNDIDEKQLQKGQAVVEGQRQVAKRNKKIKKKVLEKNRNKGETFKGSQRKDDDSDEFQIDDSDHSHASSINALSRQLTSNLVVQSRESFDEQSQKQPQLSSNSQTNITNTTVREEKYKQYKEFTNETTQNIKPDTHPLAVLSPGQFFAKRLYQCGECRTLYNYSQELNIHISLYHKGDIPQGTIWGPQKLLLYNMFRIPYSKFERGPTAQHLIKYRCGCGILYSAGPALAKHIKKRHDSIPPTGTIGLTYNSCAKLVVEEYGMKGYIPYDQ